MDFQFLDVKLANLVPLWRHLYGGVDCDLTIIAYAKMMDFLMWGIFKWTYGFRCYFHLVEFRTMHLTHLELNCTTERCWHTQTYTFFLGGGDFFLFNRMVKTGMVHNIYDK